MSEPELPPAEGILREDMVQWFVDHRKKLCLLPWVNIHTNPDGKLKLCCNIHLDHFIHKHDPDANGNVTNFNLGYDDIETIWNSRYMSSVRIRHHSNTGSDECQGCDRLEETTGHSPRVGQNKVWIENQKTDEIVHTHLVGQMLGKVRERHVDLLPVSLELRLGNQCNLQCVTCWGMSSSLIHDERKDVLKSGIMNNRDMEWLIKKWEDDEHLVDRTDLKEWFETDMFYSNFKKLAPNLRRLYTTGGEPTLIKANYKMFQMLLDEDNTDCRIEFTSNMTTWNPEFYKRLEKFKNVEIQMSIDGVDDIAEYIRYPSNFSNVRENIFKAAELVSTRPGWTLKCFTVLQALNLQHIEPIWAVLKEACEHYNIKIDWWPITLSHPDHLSVKSVPHNVRNDAVSKLWEQRNKSYSGLDDVNSFYISEHTMTILQDALENTPYSESHNFALRQFIVLNDEIRHSDGYLIFMDLISTVL